MIINRRSFNTTLASSALATLTAVSATGLIGKAFAANTVSEEDLATPSPLGDMMLGSPSATVTIVEYASMSCPHCAHFQETIFPKLKQEYIDTGKVRYIFREFPLDLKAAGGSMLARCIAKDDPNKYFAVVDILFRTQSSWIPSDTVTAFKRIGRQAGFSDQSVENCLADHEMEEAIKKTADHATEKLKVNSTPTFFINGTELKGGSDIEEFRKLIDPLLKS